MVYAGGAAARAGQRGCQQLLNLHLPSHRPPARSQARAARESEWTRSCRQGVPDSRPTAAGVAHRPTWETRRLALGSGQLQRLATGAAHSWQQAPRQRSRDPLLLPAEEPPPPTSPPARPSPPGGVPPRPRGAAASTRGAAPLPPPPACDAPARRWPREGSPAMAAVAGPHRPPPHRRPGSPPEPCGHGPCYPHRSQLCALAWP